MLLQPRWLAHRNRRRGWNGNGSLRRPRRRGGVRKGPPSAGAVLLVAALGLLAAVAGARPELTAADAAAFVDGIVEPHLVRTDVGALIAAVALAWLAAAASLAAVWKILTALRDPQRSTLQRPGALVPALAFLALTWYAWHWRLLSNPLQYQVFCSDKVDAR